MKSHWRAEEAVPHSWPGRIEGAEVSHAPLSEEIGAESIDCTPGDAAFYCGDDVPGDYEIMAQAEGFQIGSAAVSVEMDEVGCHVVTQSVDITLAAELAPTLPSANTLN